jgi:hypothetical protein
MSLEKRPEVPIGWEAGWAPELVWLLWRRISRPLPDIQSRFFCCSDLILLGLLAQVLWRPSQDEVCRKYIKICIKFSDNFSPSRPIRLSLLVQRLQSVKSDGIGNTLRLVFCRCWVRISAPTPAILNEVPPPVPPPWFSRVPPDEYQGSTCIN